jgi:hypothetical protein
MNDNNDQNYDERLQKIFSEKEDNETTTEYQVNDLPDQIIKNENAFSN